MALLFPRAICKQFRNQVSELLGEDHQLLGVIAPLLSIHEHICEQQSKFDDEVRRLAKSDETARRLMTLLRSYLLRSGDRSTLSDEKWSYLQGLGNEAREANRHEESEGRHCAEDRRDSPLHLGRRCIVRLGPGEARLIACA